MKNMGHHVSRTTRSRQVALMGERAFTSHIGRWAERKREEHMMRQFGGLQRCPWCRQWAQDGMDWHFKPYAADPSLDCLSCGVCGGTSLWLWGMGFMLMRALDAPAPREGALPYQPRLGATAIVQGREEQEPSPPTTSTPAPSAAGEG